VEQEPAKSVTDANIMRVVPSLSFLSLSAEMESKLDGTLPSLLPSNNGVSQRRLQGIQFKNVSLTVRNPFKGNILFLFVWPKS
jgi:hypothetical protein